MTALVLAGCSSGPGALPRVPTTLVPPATTTTDVDYSNVPLRGVGGRSPTTSVVFGPGHATVGGTVVGEEGVIAGATVLVERVVSGSVGAITVQTAEDGSWTLPQVFGGRYRVRAWRVPDLIQTTPTAVFLGSSETKTVPLKVKTVGGLSVSAAIAPDPPRLGEDANLVVLVALKVVDEQGVARATPQDNVAVDLVGNSGWGIRSANPTVTDSNGHAAWVVHCRSEGRQSLAVTVGPETIGLKLNDCVDVVEETTTSSTETTLVP